MRTREDIEQLENQILAPYAMKSKDSSGRIYDEPKHPTRTCYQRDRDRIVHSEAFRKLEYKTQVFVIFEGDYYRTRLTHTIEVAQLARTIGRNLRLNEDLIEAIALAHDLGHPPFGHAGEDELNAILARKGLKFNHNFRSYQIVNEIEKRYPSFCGLNLTREVLVGLLTHQTDYDTPEKDDIVDGEAPTLEAQVVDIADSLAYLNHDIDDGLTSGCITPEDLMDSALWSRSYEKLRSKAPVDNEEMFKYQIVKELIDVQAKDLLNAAFDRLKAANFQSSDDVKARHEYIIEFSSHMKKERDELQKILFEKLYHHYRVERMTAKARRVVKDLFYVYLANPRQLPYTVYPRDKQLDKNDPKLYQLIADYIASMTDRSAFDEHRRLFEPYQKV